MDAPMTPALPPELAAIVARAEEMYRDLGLPAVRRWRERHPGAKAIGFLPIYVPREVIHAAGMLPVGIVGAGEQIEIVKGDAYFQSYICHLPRSVLELALNGSLDDLDGAVFPSTCDVIRNLSGMWQLLFPKKYVRYLDLPQDFSDEIGGRFYEHEIRSLARDLESIGGTPVTDERLRASIALYDANREAVEALYRARIETPWLVPSSEVYVVMRAGNALPVEEHTAMLREYLAAARGSGRHPMDMARVVLRGTFCEQPPLDLVRTLERSGCTIVDDDWLMPLRWFRGPVGAEGDPFSALSRAFLRKSPACPSIFSRPGEKGKALVDAVRESKAEGVLFAAPSFCDPALLDQPMTMTAVKNANIPCTSFLYAENTGQFQTIREQAGTFADAIKLA